MRRKLFLEEFVIMPNHLHAIVIIDKTHDTNNINDINVDTHSRAYLHLDHSIRVFVLWDMAESNCRPHACHPPAGGLNQLS